MYNCLNENVNRLMTTNIFWTKMIDGQKTEHYIPGFGRYIKHPNAFSVLTHIGGELAQTGLHDAARQAAPGTRHVVARTARLLHPRQVTWLGIKSNK